MRSVLLALMFSGSVFALSANAYAQSSPDTRQTDQSEEDWRKSKKKGGTSSEDILDIIENTRSTGVGNGRGYSPIDALPEESRRHLMKERAKRMAQAGPNEPVDVSYKPSEAAKSDSDLQDDEKAAWEKMAQGMNGAPDQGLQGQGQGQGQGQQGQQGQSGQQGQGQQGGGQSSDGSGQSGQSRSVMRGGSAASVSDIMARIKGLTPGQGQGGQGQRQQGQGSQGQQRSPSGFGQGPLGQGQQGQSQQGQSQQGQSQQGQSQSQQQSQNQGQQQSQTIAQSQQNGSSQSPSQSDAQKQADAQDQAQAQAEAQAQAAAKAEAANKAHALSHAPASPQSSSSTRTPEAISPLDRIKKVNQEQNRSGSRSSASDYLKKTD